MKLKKLLLMPAAMFVALHVLAGVALAAELKATPVKFAGLTSEYSIGITSVALIVFSVLLWDVLRGSNFSSLWGWMFLVGIFSMSYGVSIFLPQPFKVPIHRGSALFQFLSITGALFAILRGQRKTIGG